MGRASRPAQRARTGKRSGPAWRSARVSRVAAEAAAQSSYLTEAAARTYLTEHIRYDVGPREEEGLIRYYDFLVEDGLAPPGWQPDPLPVEEVSV